MHYKVVAIDCDGTLINNEFQIPEENIQTIQALKEKGVTFLIVTGRNDILVKHYIDTLGISAPVIGCNGASTRDIIHNKLYAHHPVSTQSLRDVYHYFKSNHLTLDFFGMDCYYTTNKKALEDAQEHFYFRWRTQFLQTRYIEDIEELIDAKAEILKMCFLPGTSEEIERVRKDMQVVDNLDAFRSSKFSLDMVAKNVSKGNALLEYLKIMDIPPEYSIAIGDSENDASMLQSAGLSIAMGNAEPLVKDMAQMITDTNINAGVAKALKNVYNL